MYNWNEYDRPLLVAEQNGMYLDYLADEVQKEINKELLKEILKKEEEENENIK